MLDAVRLVVNISRGNLSTLDPALAAWQGIGMGGGGAMFSPAVDPHDPTHVVLASDMTGSFVSFDNGASWKNFNLRTVVGQFTFDPQQPGVVYALNTGVYRSEDGGRTWRLLLPEPSTVIAERMAGDHAEAWYETAENPEFPVWGYSCLRVDPTDSRHLLVAKKAPYLGKVKLLISHDRGQSWQAAAPELDEDPLAIFPGSWWNAANEWLVVTANSAFRFSESGGSISPITLPGLPVIAAGGGRVAGGSSSFYLLTGRQLAGSVGGVFRSDNLGATWRSTMTGVATGTGQLDLTALAVCEGDPRVAYLSCGWDEATTSFGIFKTIDSGEHWSWSWRSRNWAVPSNYSGSWLTQQYGVGWAGAPLSMGVSPTNPDVCYGTNYGAALHTTDGGAHWAQVHSDNRADGSYSTRGLNVTAQYGVHFDPLDSLHLVVSCTDIGMFASGNGGESWKQTVTGVPSEWINTCYWLEFDPTVKDKLWAVWSNCHDLPRLKMWRSGNIQNGRYAGGVTLSTDGGRTWRQAVPGLPANAITTHILVDPTSPVATRTLYACVFNQGVFKSTDGGNRWTKMNNGLDPANLCAWRIVRAPDGALFLLVTRSTLTGGWNDIIDGGLYVSRDGAANWSKVALPTGVYSPNDLVIDPSQPQRMYLASWPREDRSGAPWRARYGGVLRSEDGGATWQRVLREDVHAYAVGIDPHNPATIVAGTFDSAIFRSDDRGDTWRRLEGYNFKWSYRPIFDPYRPGLLYVTTFGGGTFRGPARGVPGAPDDIVNYQSRWRWGD